MSLSAIQKHLEAIYALDVPHCVEDFVIDDSQLQGLVTAGVVGEIVQSTDEHVLVHHDGDELSIAVYVSDRVRAGLRSGADLQQHCHATEGVSHFVMLSWSALEGRRVRALDLELQAELDKAATVLLLDRGATGGQGARELLRRLFDGAVYADHLDADERDRYREAHRLAARYSRHLAGLLDQGVARLLEELRSLYRLPAEEKRVVIARAA
ncbi:MAG: hypothetical protein GY898_18925 [Proteobacteria bacterium]|nr:hypothetical protein [Pseudomonadota bacterium]